MSVDDLGLWEHEYDAWEKEQRPRLDAREVFERRFEENRRALAEGRLDPGAFVTEEPSSAQLARIGDMLAESSIDDEPTGDDEWTRERDEARARARGLGAALWLLAIVAGVVCGLVAFLLTRDALAIGLAFVAPLLLVWGAAIERQDASGQGVAK